MSKAAQQSEPSMEEILASIRKIISDENDAPAAEAAKPAEKPEPEPAPAAGKKPEPAAEPGELAAPEPVAAEEEASDDILELTDDMIADTPKKVEPVDPEISFGDMTAEQPAAQAAPEKPAESKPSVASASAAIADRLLERALGDHVAGGEADQADRREQHHQPQRQAQRHRADQRGQALAHASIR